MLNDVQGLPQLASGQSLQIGGVFHDTTGNTLLFTFLDGGHQEKNGAEILRVCSPSLGGRIADPLLDNEQPDNSRSHYSYNP